MKAITCTVSADRGTLFNLYVGDLVYVGAGIHGAGGIIRRPAGAALEYAQALVRRYAIAGDTVMVYRRTSAANDAVEQVPAALIDRVELHAVGTSFCSICDEVTVRTGRQCARCQREAA